jgi:hypothetical protein
VNDLLLELELRLLILRHGRETVLQALAAIREPTFETVQEAIAVAEKRKRRGRPDPPPTSELVIRMFGDRPKILPVVQALTRDYENRTFLPQLRDVQRFLDRLGATRGRLKSRRLALGQLIRALRRLEDAEIEQLADASQTHGDSDYALLAREIMGSGAGKAAALNSHRDTTK